MKKSFYILIFIALGSCQNDKSKRLDKTMENLTVEEKRITQTFSEVDSLLTIDNGKFWGKELYGPLLLINPETKVFYSNENNSSKDFKKINSIFTDSLRADLNIANTAFHWDDKRWSMVMLPLPTAKISRNNLIIHELFHRLQPEIGFENMEDLNNGHLDTYEGRLLLKLELQALEKALINTVGHSKLEHIRNALMFRNKRYKNQEIKVAENSLELNEGLAEYTAIVLSSRNQKEMETHLIQNKNDFFTNPTFVRSFAYQTVPFYGYLLSSTQPNWHREIDRKTNLTDFFINAFDIDIDTNQRVEAIVGPNDYGYQKIEKEEIEREKKRIEKITELKTKFLEEPTLAIPFQNMNISFDPRNIAPLENYGTVYPNLRITDDWGILTVEDGALLAPDWSKVIVSLPNQITDKIVTGRGWKLELSPEWVVKKNGDGFKLLKK